MALYLKLWHSVPLISHRAAPAQHKDTSMPWVKAFHVIFMVTWFAGMFYLPRLFVYHATADDGNSRERFKIMERKLYFGILTSGAVLTIALGMWMLIEFGWAAYSLSGWLHAKLALVALLVGYH